MRRCVGGDGEKDITALHVFIDYQTVKGLPLPAQLRLKGSYNGSSFKVEVALNGCKMSCH